VERHVHVPTDCAVSGHPYARKQGANWVCVQCGAVVRFAYRVAARVRGWARS
jgi:hypothetical protein